MSLTHGMSKRPIEKEKMMQVGRQLHLSRTDKPLEPARFQDVRNSEDMGGRKKPQPGTGFWTSSWSKETRESDWVRWYRANMDNPYKCAWHLLTPREDAKLYIIDDLADLLILIDTYPWETPRQQRVNAEMARIYSDPVMSEYHVPLLTTKRNSYYAFLDFEKMAQDYDGIWLTEEGNGATYLSDPHDLNAWSSESVLWLRWCFAQVEQMKTPVPVAVASEE